MVIEEDSWCHGSLGDSGPMLVMIVAVAVVVIIHLGSEEREREKERGNIFGFGGLYYHRQRQQS